MDIADARYVSLTTFRRNGEAVAIPVWIARLDDGRVCFTTDATSGKVKRIRNRGDVTLQASDVRGKVADGAETVTGTAVVLEDGADYDAATAAVARKYGLQYKAMEFGAKVKGIFGERRHPAAVVITLT